MECPKCSEVKQFRVIATEHREDGTHRWRRCHSCGFKYRTLEIPYRKEKPGPIPGTPRPGARAMGSRNGSSVLLENDVMRLRYLSATGVPNFELAKQFGIAAATVSRIINRKVWQHI